MKKVCRLPPQPPLAMAMTAEQQQQQLNKHLDHDEDRDPHYDYDHSIAHHAGDLRRLRAMSVGHLPSPIPRPTSYLGAENSKRHPELDLAIMELNESRPTGGPLIEEAEKHRRRRRGSHDEVRIKPRKFLIDVQATLRKVLDQEDTDGNCQITITDAGPKLLTLGTVDSRGHNKFEVRGTYALANLLQELAVASDHGRRFVILDEMRLTENPVDRLSRLIKHHFWDGLTRRIDADGLEMICLDPKNRSVDQQMRIYVPFDDQMAFDYFNRVAVERPVLKLDVVRVIITCEV
jgi:alpha,alpha-trehalase